MRKINIGVIGAGRVAQIAYINNLIFDKRANLTAVCDINQKLVKEVATKFNIPNAYTSFEKMIKNHEFDLIFLIINRQLIEKISLNLINHKKKFVLFTEKPFALSYKSGKNLIKSAKNNKRTHFVGYMKRHDEGVNYLKKNIEKLNLGKIKSVYYQSFDGDSYCGQYEYIKYKYRLKKNDNPRYKYLNTQSHSLNLLKYLFGYIKILSSNIDNKGEGVAVFKNKKNIKIILNNQFGFSKSWEEKLMINFEYGLAEITMPPPFLKNKPAEVFIENFKTGDQYKPFIKWSWSFNNQVKNLIDFILKRKKNNKLCSSAECLGELKVIEKLFRK